MPRLRIFDVRSAIAGRGTLVRISWNKIYLTFVARGYITRLVFLSCLGTLQKRESWQTKRFSVGIVFNDYTESQQQTLVAAAVSQMTKQTTGFWWGVHESFCREKCVSVDVKTISASALADVLKKFYGGLTTKKGGTYQATSYLSARAAIQRKVTAANRLFNLRVDSEFRESNIVLDAVLKHNKVSGQATQRNTRTLSPTWTRTDLRNTSKEFWKARTRNSFRCFAGTTWHDTWVFAGRRCS